MQEKKYLLMDQKNLSLKNVFDEWEKFDESEKLDSLPPNLKEKKNLRRELIIEEEKWKKDFFPSKSWS